MRGNNRANLKPLLKRQLKGQVQLKEGKQCGLDWQKQVHVCTFVCKVQNVKQQV